jgi:hypothetical protein
MKLIIQAEGLSEAKNFHKQSRLAKRHFATLPGQSETFTKQLLRKVFKFSGEPQTEDFIENIYQEVIKREPISPGSNI